MIELWLSVPGYEGLYEASSLGQIRSLPRRCTRGKILTPQLNNSGYFRVSISKQRKPKYLYVHHLVAYAFIGPRPEGYDINHINGDKTDNRSENLEYVTRSENMKHARKKGLHDNRGEKHYGSKLTDEIVRDILFAYSTCGLRGKDMANSLGISRRAIDDVLDGKTWRHINE